MLGDIVLIEDNVLHRKLYSEIIQKLGYRSIEIEDERHAIEGATEVKPVAMIIDIRLPHVDGRTIIRQVREEHSISSVPILALSAATEPDLEQACLEAGANCFYAKPVALPTLMNAITSLAGQYS